MHEEKSCIKSKTNQCIVILIVQFHIKLMSWNQEKTNVENGGNYVIQLELGNAECSRNAIQGGDPGRRAGGVQGGSLVLLPAEPGQVMGCS